MTTTQPRALTVDEQRAQATRSDLWPEFLPAPDGDPGSGWDYDGHEEDD